MVLDRSYSAALIAVALTVMVSVYAPVRTYGPVYEDQLIPATAGVSWMPRLFTIATLRGQSANVAHLDSVLIHGVNSALIAVILWPFSGVAAALGAILWALHPIQQQAVIYLSARADLLMVTGVLVMVLAASIPGWFGVVGALWGCLIALAAKESGIVAVGLLAVWGIYRGDARRFWPVYALGLVGAIWLAVRFVPNWTTWNAPTQQAYPWFVSTQAAAIWRLLALVVYPKGFTIVHDWELISHTTALIGAVAFALLMAFGWHARRSALGMAALWIGVALLPRLLIPLPQYVSESQIHVALVGPALSLAALKG